MRAGGRLKLCVYRVAAVITAWVRGGMRIEVEEATLLKQIIV